MARKPFSFSDFAVRLLAAAVLVVASYNPSGYSYFHWAIQPLPEFSVPKAFIGVVLLIGYTMFLRATGRSLGFFGVLLTIAFFGTLTWLIVDTGVLPIESVTALTWVVLAVFSCVLAVGMSWSHVRRRISGQLDVDDVEDEAG